MKIQTTWDGNKQFTTTNEDGNQVITDAKKSSGGSEKGQTPAELLVSALAGCMGITMMTSLENYEEGVDHLELSAEGIKAEDLPSRIEKIILTIDIKTAVSKDKVDRIIKLAHDKYCTVSNSLNVDLEIHTNYL